MRFRQANVLITGAASGLGAALADVAVERGASSVVLVDRDDDGLDVAAAAGPRRLPVRADLADPADIRQAIATASTEVGPLDVVIANAGIIAPSGLDAEDDTWQLGWDVHVMSNVRLFREVIPDMMARDHGWLASTASSASFAPHPKSAVYSVTKHAQLALAEWVNASLAGTSVGLTCFCPGGMRTPMLDRMRGPDAYSEAARAEADTPPAAARLFADGIEDGLPLVMSKERSADELALRGQDYDAWLRRAADRFRPGS